MIVIKIDSPKSKDRIKLYDDLRIAEGKLKEKERLSENYYEHHVPELPLWTNKEYNSSDAFGNGNKINLFHLTCTCEDFQNRQSYQDKRDIRRCCKHIYYKLKSSAASKCIDDLTLLLIHSSVFFNENFLYKYLIKEKEVYFGFNQQTNWINIYALNIWNEEGIYMRYSFNPIEHRWSYERAARQKELIEYYLMKTIEYQLPYEHNYVRIKKILQGK